MSNRDDFSEDIEQKSHDLSLLETFITYLRHWRWYMLSVIISLIVAYFYIRLGTPQYKIETRLLIKDNKSAPGGQNDLLKSLDMFTSDKIIDNEIQLLKSDIIIEKVIKKLAIGTSYSIVGRITEKELYLDKPFSVQLLNPSLDSATTTLSIQLLDQRQVMVNGKKNLLNTPISTKAGIILVTINPKGEPAYRNKLINVRFAKTSKIVQHYSDNLVIDPVSKQGTVLIISIEDELPKRGQAFLNALVEAYDREAVEDKNKVTSQTLSFIEDRLKVISSELGVDEKNVEKYKSSNHITDIGVQSQLFLQSVKDNDANLNKVHIQLSEINNLENYLNSNRNESSKLPSMLGIEDPTMLGLVNKLAEVEVKRESLLKTIPDSNPIVSSLDDQIESIKRSLSSTAEDLRNSLQITMDHLTHQNNHFESTISQVPSKEHGLLDVMRQQEIKNALFTYLLQKREETAMQLASDVADSRIINYAKSSENPVKPVKRVIYLIILLIAFIFPTVVIYLRRLFNYKVIRRNDIELVTETPILAEISQSNFASPLLVIDHPRSMVAEQIRVLRTNLQFIIPDEGKKVILFTSNISGEGKSFVSLNLGGSFALASKKVVILELDLRKPKLHGGLQINNELGLSNYLIGKAELENILKPIPSQENYFIITSGPIPPNPAELLSNGKIEVLIERLKKEFDYILLDAPPVGLVTDAQILGAFADITLFIVRHNYTTKNSIITIDDLYHSNKFKRLSIVLNSVDLQMGYGSSYGYGYGYGYGYQYGGYYQENTKRPNFIKRIFNIKT